VGGTSEAILSPIRNGEGVAMTGANAQNGAPLEKLKDAADAERRCGQIAAGGS
jgi:hypothetical protein